MLGPGGNSGSAGEVVPFALGIWVEGRLGKQVYEIVQGP
jgi:hypothetical protein